MTPAKWLIYSDKQVELWKEWVGDRPGEIQRTIASNDFRPDRVYRIKATGQFCKLQAFREDGTLIVGVWHKLDPKQILGIVADRAVTGLLPEDLELVAEEDYAGIIVDSEDNIIRAYSPEF